MKKLMIILALFGLIFWPGNPSAQTNSSKQTPIQTKPIIELKATLKDVNTVVFYIKTNIPLPIEVMAGLDLKNQKPTDIYIGTDKEIKIDTSPFTYNYDISEDKLPSGDYLAVVTFYPTWGADNGNELAKEIASKVEGTSSISLVSSHGTAEQRMKQDKKQLWIMNNVFMDTPWVEEKFVNELGGFQELEVTNRNPEFVKAYYFSEADMTIFINKLKMVVVTYRLGKVSTL